MDDNPINSNTGRGRKPDWNNMPTTVIRVPVVFAESLLGLARLWDASGIFVQKYLPSTQGKIAQHRKMQ